MSPRAGIVAIVGKPNAGKSTLLNRLIGQRLGIVSPKPQSTRDRVIGVRSVGDTQMVFFDTPGLLDPTYALQRAMRNAALSALADADVIVYVADATQGPPPPLTVAASLDRAPRAPIILTLNKLDKLSPATRTRLSEDVDGSILLSAEQGDGVDQLLEAIAIALPESPFLYPAEEVTTQPLRYFASEFVREAAINQLDEEVPYSVACEIEEFHEDRSPMYIRAVLYVERDSQKRILIGAGGTRIKQIGVAARKTIERLVDAPVYLDLWVKVLPNWRRMPRELKRFGYHLTEGQTE